MPSNETASRSTELSGRNIGSADYIFVVGCGHSGTSLVTAMLGAHPAVYAIPFETAAFMGDRSDSDARAVIENALRKMDKPAKRICEKTPTHVHQADRIRETFPGSRFIICLRDPRDVVCSIKRRMNNTQEGISRWKRDNTVAMRLMEREDCFALHYESLVNDPEALLARLCSFLQLEYDPAMMDYWQDDRNWFHAPEQRDTDGSHGVNHTIRRNWQIHQPLMTNRIGVWQSELTADELTEIKKQLRELAAAAGYMLD